jgi:ABC-2 type transport system permease protein
VTSPLATVDTEVRKLIGLRSIWGAAGFSLVATPLIALMNSVSLRHALDTGNTGQLLSTSTTDSGFVELTLGLIGVVIIGVVAMSSEYRTSQVTGRVGPQITATLAATPNRDTVLVAKAIAVAVLAAPVAVAATTLTLGASRLALGSYASAFDTSIIVRAGGVVLYWVLTAELVFAATVLIRNGVVPLVIGIGNASFISVSFLLSKLTRWARYLPDAAGARLFIREAEPAHHLGPLAGGLTMVFWTVTVLAVAMVVFVSRDA